MKPPDSPRLLSEFDWSKSKRYRGVLGKNLVVELKRPQWAHLGRHDFYDGDLLLATLDGCILTIYAGYASDLCSPAIKIGRWWVGTPTTNREALAAFIHDALRQLLSSGLACVPWDRKDTDDIFFEFLVESGSIFAGIYHGAVAGVVGTAFLRLTSSKSTITCSVCEIKHG